MREEGWEGRESVPFRGQELVNTLVITAIHHCDVKLILSMCGIGLSWALIVTIFGRAHGSHCLGYADRSFITKVSECNV